MGRFTEKLIFKIFDTSYEVHKFSKSINNFVEQNKPLFIKIGSGDEIDIDDFLALYDQRIYDIRSKQEDIKYMKSLDFKGVYCIKNNSKQKYYIGMGDKVFRKVERHFKGYGNQDIFSGYNKKNQFSVMFFRFEGSGYDSLTEYENCIKKEKANELVGYQYYFPSKNNYDTEVKYTDTPDENNNESDSETRNDNECKKALKKKRWKAFWLKKKKIALEVSVSELVGANYEDALNILENNGFNNVTCVCIKDIYTESSYRVGEVEKIILPSDYNGEFGEMIPYDARIDIKYHMKKELCFPYSTNKLRKINVNEICNELKMLGFTQIKLLPINDLKKGWIVKDGSIEKVIVKGCNTIKKGVTFEYDVPIEIYFHTFR